jgi:hypothetical protein
MKIRFLSFFASICRFYNRTKLHIATSRYWMRSISFGGRLCLLPIKDCGGH